MQSFLIFIMRVVDPLLFFCMPRVSYRGFGTPLPVNSNPNGESLHHTFATTGNPTLKKGG